MEPIFKPGDLLWTKIGKYPFWPSMVAYDPSSGNYWKKNKTERNSKPIYYIEFFGEDVKRGWSSRVFLFDGAGESEFNEKKEKLLSEARGRIARKNIQVTFNIPEGQKAAWRLAIAEALDAFKVSDLTNRFQQYKFLYKGFAKIEDKEESKPAPISCDSPQLLSQQESDQHQVERGKKKSSDAPISTDNPQQLSQQESDQRQVERGKKKSSDDSLELPPVKKTKQNDEEFSFHDKKITKKKLLSDEDFNDVCKVCEMGMVEFSCSGRCRHSYHAKCLGLPSIPNDFKCEDCTAGKQCCFVCKTYGGAIKKCKYSKCEKFYHNECLDKYCYTRIRNSFSEKICGYHSCLTCYKENAENITSFKGPFIRCFRCPTAFHNRESCVAAGLKHLTKSTVICPDHFKESKKSTSLINISKCLMCEEGGELICCETCPQAYHKECLETTIPKGDFFCEDCVSRKPFSYGMIVLGKTGKYRFWPAVIISPNEIPENLKNMSHREGEFVIKYFATNDYTWTHKGRLLPYSEEYKNNIRMYKKRKLDIQYEESFKEADIAFRNYQAARYSLNDKPEVYKHIRVNKAIHPAVITYSEPDVEPCNCKQDGSSCDAQSTCVNRSLRTECVKETCSAIGKCQNRKFQERHYPKLKVIKTVKCGWGLAAEEKIEKGQFIIEYVGEVITHEEYERRCKDMRDRNKKNFYFLHLDGKRMIDAGPSGNISRFINHSCSPNCELQKWKVNGDSRVGVFALMDLLPGIFFL